MKSYLISTVTDFIDAPIALVYSIVTDNSNFQWRKEVKDIELLNITKQEDIHASVIFER